MPAKDPLIETLKGKTSYVASLPYCTATDIYYHYYYNKVCSATDITKNLILYHKGSNAIIFPHPT